MKTLLPSGVCTYPVLATRSKVCVEPDTVPGVQTMPTFGAFAGRPKAGAARSSSAPVASATDRPSRRVLCVIVAVLPLASRDSRVGLADHRLGRQRRLIDADLGHHPALWHGRIGAWRARVGEL